jgi:hypothetical protein
MTNRDHRLQPFDALIGRWATQATHPAVDAVVPGNVTFEWLDDGPLRIWRDDPAFAQRFSATLAPDEFEGRWQLARTPGEWRDDLQVTYRHLASRR